MRFVRCSNLMLVLFVVLLISCQTLVDDGKGKKRVLWIGTSIPEGCTYPTVACRRLGLACINKAIGSSFVCDDERYYNPPFSKHYGLSLSLSSDEKEHIYRKYVNSGELSESLLEVWKNASYDRCLMEYVKNVDYVVFDHGYNDGDILEKDCIDADLIDWQSENRHSFIGAFNYLYRKMLSVNPNIKVIVGGYFQNKCTMRYTIRGRYLEQLYEKIGRHYNLPVLDVWNYVDIPDGYIPNSAGYIDYLNEQYGMSFVKVFSDDDGNISYFQKFCPDGVHPFSDPTGVSNKILNDVFTNLLRNIVSDASLVENKVENMDVTELFLLNGVRMSGNHVSGIIVSGGRKILVR